MDPAFLTPCVTQLNGLSMVRARRYNAYRSRHENWQKRWIPGTWNFWAFNYQTSSQTDDFILKGCLKISRRM